MSLRMCRPVMLCYEYTGCSHNGIHFHVRLAKIESCDLLQQMDRTAFLMTDERLFNALTRLRGELHDTFARFLLNPEEPVKPKTKNTRHNSNDLIRNMK